MWSFKTSRFESNEDDPKQSTQVQSDKTYTLARHAVISIIKNIRSFSSLSALPAALRSDIFRYLIADSRNPLHPECLKLFLDDSIRTLNFSYSLKVNLEIIKKVKDLCPSLETLVLNSCLGINPETLKYVCESFQHSLVHLDLTRCFKISHRPSKSCQTSVNTLEPISLLGRLRILSLRGVFCSDEALELILNKCPDLVALNLYKTPTGSIPLEIIGRQFPNMVVLELANTKITDDALDVITAGCPRLAQLSIYGCQVHNHKASVSNILHRCKQMEYLDLGMLPLEDASCFNKMFRALLPAPQNAPGVDVRISERSGGDQLRQLLVPSSLIMTQDIAIMIQVCPNISVLDLSYCQAIRDDAIRMIALSPLYLTLTTLIVRGCVSLAGTHLHLLGEGAGDRGVPPLANLSLSQCAHIDRDALVALANAGLPNMQFLNLRSVPVDDATLSAFVVHCPSLRSLNLAHNTELSASAVHGAAACLAQLQTLDVRGCDIAAEAVVDMRALNPKLSVYFGMASRHTSVE